MKKTTKRITGVVLLSATLIGAGTLGWLAYTEPHLELSLTEAKFEYGDPVDIDVGDFVKSVPKDDVKVSYDKDAADVGTYKIEFEYTTKYFKQTETAEASFVIEDTTAPEFTDEVERVVIDADAMDLDVARYFKATDLSDEVEITVDLGEVDLTQSGLHDVVVKATDKYGNETEKKVVLEIVSNVTDGAHLTAYADTGEVPVSEETETKIVEGKVSVENAIGTNGGTIGKGKYSTDEKQKAYEKKLAEEKKKKEEEERKKKEEKEAAKKLAQQQAEAEEAARLAELQRQAEELAAVQQQTYTTYTAPTTTQTYSTSSGSSVSGSSAASGSTSKTQSTGNTSSNKTSTTTTSTTTSNKVSACDDSIPSGAFRTYGEALKYVASQTKIHIEQNQLMGSEIHSGINGCGNLYYQVIFTEN